MYFLNVSGFPTAHRPAWRSGPLHVGVSLPLGPIHNGPSKDAFQLFGLWWGDGVAADRQLHQRQTHAPHVRLYRVVSALQSLRLLRNTQSTSVGAGTAKTPGRREGWAEGWVSKAQEVEGRNNGRERGGGRCYGKELGCGEGKRIENGSAWHKSKSGVLDCFR